MTFLRPGTIGKIKKIYAVVCDLYSYLRRHWGKITLLIFMVGLVIVGYAKSDSWYSLAASITSPFAKNLREGIIDTENQQILKAGNTIYIDAELTSEHQGPILFWNDKPEKLMLSIKNTGEKVLSSRVIDGSSYDILTNLRVSYLDYNDKVVYNFEKELREPVQKGPPKWQPVDFPLPKIMSGEIQISLSCKDAQELCDTTRTQPLKRVFELRYDIKDTQTIIVDATFGMGIDNIEVEAFRENFNRTFNLSTEDSEKILRAIYSTDAVQEKTLGGAIILANPAKYSTKEHILVRALGNIIKRSYSHLTEEVKFIPYSKDGFNDTTYLLEGCTVKVNCPNNLGFKNLDPYKNPFSEGIFTANPNLDFLIIIPASSDKKKE